MEKIEITLKKWDIGDHETWGKAMKTINKKHLESFLNNYLGLKSGLITIEDIKITL